MTFIYDCERLKLESLQKGEKITPNLKFSGVHVLCN